MLPRAQEPHWITLHGFCCMPTCGMIQNNVSLRLVLICVHQFTEGRAPSKEWHLPISLPTNSLVITKAIVVWIEHVQLQGMSGKLSPHLSKNHEENKVSLQALFTKRITEHWPCCFFLYFVPPRCFRREIPELFQVTTFYRFNKRSPSPPMTRQLPFPNTELLITSNTHRQSLYVSHSNADPPVLRVLEWGRLTKMAE